MDVEEFDYDLPEELIAQTPARRRDESRLLLLDRKTGETEETIFKNIIDHLSPGDLLVLNNSEVIPARLYGVKQPTGTEIEVLLLNEKSPEVWEVLVRPGKRVKKGTEISFGEGLLTCSVLDYTDFGGRIVEFEYTGDFSDILHRLGEMPLPPYIKKDLEDEQRYQTVYAQKKGSAAAPTAGLHFTPELLSKIEDKGVNIAQLTLHVGLGTFRPVRTTSVEDHDMHAEYYELPETAARLLNRTLESDRRVIAVGTTVTRTLEGVYQKKKEIAADKGWTDIFIYPGFEFNVIEGLITNFHLPKSTLLMLVSAFAGKNEVLSAYQEAIEKKFRFYSLGDAMFIH